MPAARVLREADEVGIGESRQQRVQPPGRRDLHGGTRGDEVLDEHRDRGRFAPLADLEQQVLSSRDDPPTRVPAVRQIEGPQLSEQIERFLRRSVHPATAATWSGYKRSGMGQSHGLAGLKEMSRRRFVSYDDRRGVAPVFAFPYDRVANTIADAVVDRMHAPSRWGRAWAILKLVWNKRFRSRVHWRAFLTARRDNYRR